MNKLWLPIILFIYLLFISSIGEAADAQLPPCPYQVCLKTGLDKALNMETQSAFAYLQQAVNMEPENPAGYAYLAIVNLLSFETSFDEKIRRQYQEQMLRYINDAVTRGEKRIKINPKDSQAHLAMSVAKIAKIHWATAQKSYFLVALEASSIWDYLEKAKEGDPQNYDIQFLMGLFHYHIDHLPGLTRLVSSILITSGDKEKGLQELEAAAQKGHLLKQIAQLELASAYLYFEKKPARALPLYQELKEKFPNNYNLLFALANTFSDLRNFDEALKIAGVIEKQIQAGTPPFVPQLLPRYQQLMGRILFERGEYPAAAEYFQKSLLIKAPYNARVRVWSYVRLGMIHDIHKERKQALEYYARAMEVEGGEGAAQIEAKIYLKTPYLPKPLI